MMGISYIITENHLYGICHISSYFVSKKIARVRVWLCFDNFLCSSGPTKMMTKSVHRSKSKAFSEERNALADTALCTI